MSIDEWCPWLHTATRTHVPNKASCTGKMNFFTYHETYHCHEHCHCIGLPDHVTTLSCKCVMRLLSDDVTVPSIRIATIPLGTNKSSVVSTEPVVSGNIIGIVYIYSFLLCCFQRVFCCCCRSLFNVAPQTGDFASFDTCGRQKE